MLSKYTNSNKTVTKFRPELMPLLFIEWSIKNVNIQTIYFFGSKVKQKFGIFSQQSSM